MNTSNGLDLLGSAALGRLHSAYLTMATDGLSDIPYADRRYDSVAQGRVVAAEAGWPAFRSDVSQRLAIAHMNAIDGDTIGVPHNLNMQQVIDYHERVFADVGLSASTFGGNALGRNAVGQWAMGLVWYSGCE